MIFICIIIEYYTYTYTYTYTCRMVEESWGRPRKKRAYDHNVRIYPVKKVTLRRWISGKNF